MTPQAARDFLAVYYDPLAIAGKTNEEILTMYRQAIADDDLLSYIEDERAGDDDYCLRM